MTPYFAYGSNMNLERLKSWGVKVENPCSAYLLDYELVFNIVDDTEDPATAFANILPKPTSKVEGILFYTDRASIENQLDEYEGYPEFYIRKKLVCITMNMHKVSALVYSGVASKCSTKVSPSKDHLEHILAGRPYLSPPYFEKLYNYYLSLKEVQ